jgi:hypothetical protein
MSTMYNSSSSSSFTNDNSKDDMTNIQRQHLVLPDPRIMKMDDKIIANIIIVCKAPNTSSSSNFSAIPMINDTTTNDTSELNKTTTATKTATASLSIHNDKSNEQTIKNISHVSSNEIWYNSGMMYFPKIGVRILPHDVFYDAILILHKDKDSQQHPTVIETDPYVNEYITCPIIPMSLLSQMTTATTPSPTIEMPLIMQNNNEDLNVDNFKGMPLQQVIDDLTNIPCPLVTIEGMYE